MSHVIDPPDPTGAVRTAMNHGDLGARPTTMLYDEDCGLCVSAAAWLGRRVPPRSLRLIPLSRALADPAIGAAVAGRDLTATLHVLTPDGRVRIGARALLAVGRLVPRWRVLSGLFDRRLGYLILEPIYRQVARHRRAIGRRLGLAASCPMPTAHERPA